MVIYHLVHVDESMAHRARIIQSPVFHIFYHVLPIQLTLDTGVKRPIWFVLSSLLPMDFQFSLPHRWHDRLMLSPL